MTAPADPISLGIERAETLIELRRFDEAASALHRVLSQDPDNGTGWCLLARAQLGREDFDAAREAADHAVEVVPESDWAHRLRSIALGATGDHGGAIAAASQAIKLAPDEWQGHVSLSQAMGKIGSGRDAAVSAAANAVRLAPHESDAHLTLADALAAAGKREEAEAAFRRALAIDPQNSAAHNNLAGLNMPKGRYRLAGLADAASGFETAVRADPHSSIGSYNLELTLRSFLARFNFLILIIAYVTFWWLHVGSGLIVVLFGAPMIVGWRFISRIGSGLRRHLLYTITHGRVGLAAAIQLLAILVLLYAVVAPPAKHGAAAAAAFGMSLIALLILRKEIAGITGGKAFGERLLRRFALAFGLIALVFAIAATAEPTGAKSALDALVSGACCVGMIWAIRSLRA